MCTDFNSASHPSFNYLTEGGTDWCVGKIDFLLVFLECECQEKPAGKAGEIRIKYAL